MTESKWITFDRLPTPATRKTERWGIRAKDAGQYLGVISWWGPWRKYAFFPAPETLFEPTCLRDICAFIDQLMAARKETARAKRERA
jgi:hypothetical protein